jgi:dolichol-phosphate mannosyltransferase
MTYAGATLVVLCTYNERENLPELVEEILKTVPEAAILVVDDASPDGTGAWCDEAAGREPRLSCLHRHAKLGLGTAILAGMQYAIDHDYDLVVTMDADFSHHPRYLPQLLAGMTSHSARADAHPVDVMIGSRYVPGGGVEGWPLRRKVMSRGVNFLARVLLGLGIRDCSGSYRCYRVTTLRRLDFQKITARGYSMLEEILWRLAREGARFAETPITFTDRRRGKSKIDTREAMAALATLARLGARSWLGR